MSAGGTGDELFADVAWERFLRILTVVALATAVFALTATTVLPPPLSAIAVVAIGAIALVTAIIGFLIGAASTFEHVEERAAETARRRGAGGNSEDRRTDDRGR